MSLFRRFFALMLTLAVLLTSIPSAVAEQAAPVAQEEQTEASTPEPKPETPKPETPKPETPEPAPAATEPPATEPPVAEATATPEATLCVDDTPSVSPSLEATASPAADVPTPESLLYITAFDSLAPICVLAGETPVFPATLHATLSDGTEADLAVDGWFTSSGDFRSDTVGLQLLEPLVTLAPGMALGEGVSFPVLEVTVAQAEPGIFDIATLSDRIENGIVPLSDGKASFSLTVALTDGEGALYPTPIASSIDLRNAIHDAHFGPMPAQGHTGYYFQMEGVILAAVDANQNIIAVTDSSTDNLGASRDTDGQYYVQYATLYSVANIPDGVYEMRLYSINDTSASEGVRVGEILFTSAPIITQIYSLNIEQAPVVGGQIQIDLWLANGEAKFQNIRVELLDDANQVTARSDRCKVTGLYDGALTVAYQLTVLKPLEAGQKSIRISALNNAFAVYSRVQSIYCYINDYAYPRITAFSVADAATSRFRLQVADLAVGANYFVKLFDGEGDYQDNLLYQGAVHPDENGEVEIQLLYNGLELPLSRSRYENWSITAGLYAEEDPQNATDIATLWIEGESVPYSYISLYPYEVSNQKGVSTAYLISGRSSDVLKKLYGKDITLTVAYSWYDETTKDYEYDTLGTANIPISAQTRTMDAYGNDIIRLAFSYALPKTLHTGSTIQLQYGAYVLAYATAKDAVLPSVLDYRCMDIGNGTFYQNLDTFTLTEWLINAPANVTLTVKSESGTTIASKTATGIADSDYPAGKRYDFSLPIPGLIDGVSYRLYLQCGGVQVPLRSSYSDSTDMLWRYDASQSTMSYISCVQPRQKANNAIAIPMSLQSPRNISTALLTGAEAYLTSIRGESIPLTVSNPRKGDTAILFDLTSARKPSRGIYKLYLGGTMRAEINFVGSVAAVSNGYQQENNRILFSCVGLQEGSAYTATLYQNDELVGQAQTLQQLIFEGRERLYWPDSFYQTVATGYYSIYLWEDGKLFGQMDHLFLQNSLEPMLAFATQSQLITDTYLSFNISLGHYTAYRAALSMAELNASEYEISGDYDGIDVSDFSGLHTLYYQFYNEITAEESPVFTRTFYRYAKVESAQMVIAEPANGVVPGNVFAVSVYASQRWCKASVMFNKPGESYASEYPLLYEGLSEDPAYEGWYRFSAQFSASDYSVEDATSFTCQLTDYVNRYGDAFATETKDLHLGTLDAVLFGNLSSWGETYSNAEPYLLKGYASPSCEVTVTCASGAQTITQTATTNSDGAFTLTLADLPEGEWALTGVDELGLETEKAYTLIIDRTAPVVQSLAAVNSGTQNIAISWSIAEERGIGAVILKKTFDGVTTALIGESQRSKVNSYITAGRETDDVSFSLQAVDLAGNRSEVVTVRLGDFIAPTQPGGPTLSVRSSNSATFSWTASTDNFALAGYRIYRDGAAVATVDAFTLRYTDAGLGHETMYAYQIVAFDTWNNESQPSQQLNVTTVEPAMSSFATPPETACVDYPIGTAAIDLSLTVRNDGNLEGMTVAMELSADGATFAPFTPLSHTEASSTYTYHWPISSLTAGDRTLRYVLTDRDGTQAIRTFPVRLYYDMEPPSQPSAFVLNRRASKTCDVSWAASTDNVGVVGYRLWRDDVLIATVSAERPAGAASGTYTYVFSSLTPDTDYQFSVTAYDGRDNQSTPAMMSAQTVSPQLREYTTFTQPVFKDASDILPLSAAMLDSGNLTGAIIDFAYCIKDAAYDPEASTFVPIVKATRTATQAQWAVNEVDYGEYMVRYAVTDRDGTRVTYDVPLSLIRDTVPPVITVTAAPSAGETYGRQCRVAGTVTDNTSVEFVELQYSREDVQGTYTTAARKEVRAASGIFDFAWDFSLLPSGVLWYRLSAVDAYNNAVATVPLGFVADNMPPPPPADMRIMSDEEHIELTWSTAYPSEDFDHFCLYRKAEDETAFTRIRSNYKLAGYADTAFAADTPVRTNITYRYYITSVDRYGNEGYPTATLAGRVCVDTQAPEIVSNLPRQGATLTYAATLTVLASDNQALSRMVMDAMPVGDTAWIPLTTVTLPETPVETSRVFSYRWDVSALTGNCDVRFTAYDRAGHSDQTTVRYHISAYERPAATVATAQSQHKGVALQWQNAILPERLLRYTVLRAAAEAGPYQPVGTTLGVAWSDAVPVGEYWYRVDVSDQFGETTEGIPVLGVSVLMDTQPPQPSLSVSSTLCALGTELRFSSAGTTDNDAVAGYHWDFGDGTVLDTTDTQCAYTYPAAGAYTVSLTATDVYGNADAKTISLRVIDPAVDNGFTNTTLSVVDAQTGNPIANAKLSLTGPDGYTVQTATDLTGKQMLLLPLGRYTASVEALQGYRPRTPTFTVTQEPDTFVFSLSKIEIVAGNLTCTDMTLEEIEAAGIDVSNPDNQHVYRYQVVLEFTATLSIPTLPIFIYKNAAGQILGSGMGMGCSSTFTYSGVLNGLSYSIHPISERFFLVIWGRVNWLKEMFHVQLLLVNQSTTESLSPCYAELKLPEGLSFAAMTNGRQNQQIVFDEIGPEQNAVADWYIRGDKEGSYPLTAHVCGESRGEGGVTEAFEYTYATEEPVQVLAGSAMKLKIVVPDAAFHGERYKMRFELSNESEKTLYNVSHGIEAIAQYQATGQGSYSTADGFPDTATTDWTCLSYQQFGDSATIFVPKLNPGETVYLELSTVIDFYSQLDALKSRAGFTSSLAGLLGVYCPPIAAFGTLCSVLSNLDVRYQLVNSTVTTMEDSTTTIPTSVVVEHVEYPTVVEKAMEILVEEAIDKIVDGVADEVLGTLYDGYRDLGMDGIHSLSPDQLEKVKVKTVLIKALSKGALRYIAKAGTEDGSGPHDADAQLDKIKGTVINLSKSCFTSITRYVTDSDTSQTLKPLTDGLIDQFEITNITEVTPVKVWVSDGTASYDQNTSYVVDISGLPQFGIQSIGPQPEDAMGCVHVSVSTEDQSALMRNGELLFTGGTAQLSVEGLCAGEATVYIQFGEGEDAVTYYIPYVVQAATAQEDQVTVVTRELTPALDGELALGKLETAGAQSCLTEMKAAVQENGYNQKYLLNLVLTPVEGAHGYMLRIGRDFLSDLLTTAPAELVLRTPEGIMRLDRLALLSLYMQAPAGVGVKLDLAFLPVNTEQLTVTQELALAGRPITNVTAASCGKTLTSLGAGQVSIALPYRAALRETPKGVRLSDDFYVEADYAAYNDSDSSMGIVSRKLGIFAILSQLGSAENVTGENVTLRLNRSYLLLRTGANAALQAEVAPAQYARVLAWAAVDSGDQPTDVISVDERGKVTALKPGVAFVLASIRVGSKVYASRSRIDVIAAEGDGITGAQLLTNAVTVNTLQTQGPKVDVLLLVDREQQVSAYSALSVKPYADNYGAMIGGAEFANPAAAALFGLQVLDDHTLRLYPRYDANDPAALKAIARQYASPIMLTVEGQTYATGLLLITTAQQMPTVTAQAMKLNSYMSGDGAKVTFACKTATVEEALLDPAMAQPPWLAWDSRTGMASLKDNAPSSAKATLYLLAKVTDYACTVPVKVQVNVARTNAKLKLNTDKITVFAKASMAQAIPLQVQSFIKGQTPAALGVVDVQAPDGMICEGYNQTDGSFTLKYLDDVTSGALNLKATIDTGAGTVYVTLPLLITAVENAAFKLSTARAVLNPSVSEQMSAVITATPANRTLSDLTCSVAEQMNAALGADDLTVGLSGNILTIGAVKGKTKSGTTYRITVGTGNALDKPAVLLVNTPAAAAQTLSLSAKLARALDRSLPEAGAPVLLTFKNYSEQKVDGLTMQATCTVPGETAPRDATALFDLRKVDEGYWVFIHSADALSEEASYTFTFTATVADTQIQSVPLVIGKIRRTAVAVKPALASVTLSRREGDAASIPLTFSPGAFVPDAAAFRVTVTDSAKRTVLNQLRVQAEDRQLTVSAMENATPGKYLVTFQANEYGKAVGINVTVTDAAPLLRVAVAGTLDVLTPTSAVTLTPVLVNRADVALSSVHITVEQNGLDVTDRFRVEKTDAAWKLYRAQDATLDPSKVYQVSVSGDLRNGTTLVSALVKISVSQCRVKLILNIAKMTLNPSIADEATVRLQPDIALSTLGDPVFMVQDAKTKQDAAKALTLSYQNGQLRIRVNAFTEFGKQYQINACATPGNQVTTLLVSTVLQARSAVAVTLSSAGALDVLRRSCTMRFTPVFQNCGTCPPGADDIRVTQIDGVDATSRFVITPMEDGSFTLAAGQEVAAGETYTLTYQRMLDGKVLCKASKAFTVTMGTAKASLEKPAVSMYKADPDMVAEVGLTVVDATLDGLDHILVTADRVSANYSVRLLENSTLAVRFAKGGTPESGNLQIQLFWKGNTTAKPNQTVKLSVSVK